MMSSFAPTFFASFSVPTAVLRVLAAAVVLAAGFATRANADEAALTSEAARTLRDIGGLVLPIAQSDSRVDISLHLADEPITDQTMQSVVAVNEAAADGAGVAWLNLAGTDITDASGPSLATLTDLERLHLERTNIGDAAVAKLRELPNLTYLNLYGTKVTDASLDVLASMPKLTKVYVWQTGVTPAAIEAFRTANPKVDLVGEVKLVPVEFPKGDAKSDENEADAKKDAATKDAKPKDAKPDAEKSKDEQPKDDQPKDGQPKNDPTTDEAEPASGRKTDAPNEVADAADDAEDAAASTDVSAAAD